MTALLALDPAVASRLATLDPALGPLLAALPQSADGADWRLHDVVWSPGTGCRLAYRVPAGASSSTDSTAAGASSTFVDVSVTAAGWRRRDYREDDSLPGLAVAADPQMAKPRIEQAARVRIQHCVVEPVRYRPGQRAVLRYEIQTVEDRRTYFAKVFRPDHFARVAPIVTALAAGSGGRELVAPLTATWTDAHTVVAKGIGGTSVSTLLGDPLMTADQRVVIAQLLGRLLARFHAQKDVPAPRWGHGDQLAQLDRTLVAVHRADAALAARLLAVRDLLDAAPPSPRADVLAHGSFRPGQVVVDGARRLVVLDVDGVCRSHPERDLGSLLAHLDWQRVRQPHNAVVLESAAAAFMHAYEEEAGPVAGEALSWWYAAGLLLIAARRFRRLETGGWDRVPVLVHSARSLLDRGRAPRTALTPTPRALPDQLADPRHMSRVIETALAGHASGGQVTVEAAHPLPSASGRRTVVRYDVRGLDGPGPTGIVGKWFADPRRARLLYENLTLLSTAAAGSSAPAFQARSLPEPLAHLADCGLVFYRHRDGVPLSQLVDVSARTDGVRRAARWLAGLHSCPVTLPRSLDLDREAGSSRAWAAAIGMAYPDLAHLARDLANGWIGNLRSVRAVAGVPLHKDFHLDHVLIGADLHVIDFDEARQGDRAFDLAHFSAYAQVLEGGNGPGALVAIFREEYAAAAGWPQDSTLSAFEAYTWLKIARQWVVSSSPFRGRPAEQRRAGVAHALDRGLQCLSG